MTSFEELGINSALIDSMMDMGWSEPTPIQCEAVPVGMAGNDLIAKAQTGTGKTGAYAMIVLSRIGHGRQIPSAIVITPTRELAMQVDTELRKISRKSGHISTAVYGGAPIDRQINALRRGADIIVGTPGRLKDMIEREALDLSQVSEVVLDEADRMLDMGFEDDLDFIMEHIPETRHTLLFSATVDRDVQELAEDMLTDPAMVDISGDTPTTGLTKQYIIPCRKNEKKELLYELLAKGTPKTIVFFATKSMVDEIYQELKAEGVKVGTLHGDMPQKLRERVIGDFRDNHILTLLATDVAARGLDVRDVDLVINYDLPIDPETYLHRIGRTGRAGKEGISVSLVNPRDRKLVRMCEEEADTEMEKITPDGLEPIDAVHEMVFRERPKKERKMKVEKHRNNSRANSGSTEREGFATLEISLGKADGVKRSDIADFIRQRANLPEDAIGKVGLKDDVSFVEVSLDHSDYVLENMSGCEYNGKPVTISPAPEKKRYHEEEDTFDRRRENRYKNYEKKRQEESEEADAEDDAEIEEFDDTEEERRPRESRGYGRRDGGYRDRVRREYGDRPRRDFGDRGYLRREFHDRPSASHGDGYRPRRDYGDRPRRDYGDRPRRDFGDRPRRDFGDRPRRDFGDRRPRFDDDGERPRREYSDRPRRDYGDRPHRDYGDRPRRDYGDRPRRDYGDRPRGDFGDRPRRDYGDRRPRSDDGDRPRRDFGDRPREQSDRPKRYESNRDTPKRYPSNRDSPKPKRYPSNRDTPKRGRGRY